MTLPLSTLPEAIDTLRAGKFVLVHDDRGRENEIDMVVAADFIRPDHIAMMRTEAGGLLCLAIAGEIATKLGLGFMHDMIRSFGQFNPIFTRLTQGTASYGDKPSFSISVNHRDTYTGVTDVDRALTISKMAEVCNKIDQGGVEKFSSEFMTPGHIPILIASRRLLEERMGHTELCVYLAKLAGLTPAVAICEMMDSETHRALTIENSGEYRRKSGIPLLEAAQLKAHAKVV